MKDQRAVALMALVILILWILSAYLGRAHATVFPTQYDGKIQSAVGKWWPDYPFWKDWKAQLWQESRLDPNAVSSAGAVGLAQFVSPTWADIERALYAGAHVSRTLAGPAIDGGAYYVSRLRRIWASPRPLDDRQRLSQASYNGGAGSILKAQKLCGDAVLWADISPCLSQVTGPANANQALTYVAMIARWRREMN